MQGIGRVATGAIPAGASIDFMPLKTGPFFDTVQKSGKALLKSSDSNPDTLSESDVVFLEKCANAMQQHSNQRDCPHCP